MECHFREIECKHVTQLSDALIMQLNIFKYTGGISKKVIAN